jgi:hypothetical protein
LLLDACLRPDERALEAWRRWCSSIDLDHLDGPSQRLLPLLYRNLQALGVRDPILQRYKGVWRYYWCTNQKRLAHLAHLTRLLDDQSLPFVALKDLALMLAHDRDVGVRPLSDIGLLLRPEHVPQALDVLAGAGYRPLRRRGDRFELGHVGSTNAFERNAVDDSRSIDLHWRVFPSDLESETDAAFWSRARPATNGPMSANVLVMDRTDLFFHVIVHAVAFERRPPIRWVPNAAALARGPGIAWERLAGDAERLGLTRELAAALRELSGFVEVDVPAGVLERLGRWRGSLAVPFRFLARDWWQKIIGALSRTEELR